MGRWRRLTLIALVVCAIGSYFLFHPAASLAVIIAGSLVALGSTISDSKSDKSKIAWALMVAAISISGGVSGYQSGLRAQQDAKASNELLKAKTDELATTSKESRTYLINPWRRDSPETEFWLPGWVLLHSLRVADLRAVVRERPWRSPQPAFGWAIE